MDYYLLPLEKVEVDQFEQALRKINYDVDDRSFVWTEELIDKIISTMTKENAYKIIMQFLPEPVADKFTELFENK
ncbi:MAG: hypothetical protein ACTHJ7_10500 [Candidatus Nitrosocosmicus sp.]